MRAVKNLLKSGPSPETQAVDVSMPFTYTIDPKVGLLIVRAEGVVTQAERVETVMAWMTDPLFRPDLDTICDFSEAQSTPTMAELRELAGLAGRYTAYVGNARLAIVTSKAITFVVAQEFASMAKRIPLEVRVFADREEALSWLRPEQASRARRAL
jgi:SpoIIAA-like